MESTVTFWWLCTWCKRIEPYPSWVAAVDHSHVGYKYTLTGFRTRKAAREKRIGG